MEEHHITITIKYNFNKTTGDIDVTYDDEYIDQPSPENIAEILEAAAADIREQIKGDAE